MPSNLSTGLPTGKLTTHVLDTASGCPAAGIEIEFWKISAAGEKLLSKQTTNSDGRTDRPLMASGTLVIGTYELRFLVGAYFRAKHKAQTQAPLPDPPFLNEVPIRFGIADTAAHYHVPLLVSPWSYSTYRGS